MIIGDDTDIIVIALYIFCDLKTSTLDRIWLWKESLVVANNDVKLLGEEKCRALPFLYIFTGCNTVSSFCGRGKKTAWDAWSCFPKLINAF